jgi:hypothetical protein
MVVPGKQNSIGSRRSAVAAAVAALLVLVSCATPVATMEPAPPTDAPTATPVPTATAEPATDVPETDDATAPPPTELPPTEPPLPPTSTPAPVARYRLTFDAAWSADTHPTDFPRGAHWSGLIGATHGPAASLWDEGALASPGIKSMAETGSKRPLDREVGDLIDAGAACTLISGSGIGRSPDTVEVAFSADLSCPLVSVVTMIAPSPDWFVGVSGRNLMEDGQWRDEVVVELLPWDAGTDSGPSYASSNAPTSPVEPISSIEVEPLLIDGMVPALGTFTFTRLQTE